LNPRTPEGQSLSRASHSAALAPLQSGRVYAGNLLGGTVAEWTIAVALKATGRKPRGFESLPFRSWGLAVRPNPPKLGTHVGRRTVVTAMSEDGVPLDDIARHVGHRSTATPPATSASTKNAVEQQPSAPPASSTCQRCSPSSMLSIFDPSPIPHESFTHDHRH
jgi:hypothetical protein